ncbi:CAAX prenyl protease-like protein [Lentzea atacamensis]|uniref:CAAX prenyl protease-like protein n=1 Tax=Lentzea atacamensis TaxID=531938 RepID=A0ABX9EAS2_9PSEU|nr:type II CAAX endopeptidase family protein [Lentzea atacamensis]RAS67255.1 CAAX prenyl protease-like protein [Lentzea atacamensis]
MTKTTGRILLALLGFLACVFLPALLTSGLPPMVAYLVGVTGVSASALALVFLLRRYVDREPFRELGLRRKPADVVTGFVIAAVTALAAGGLAVLLGFAEWTGVPAVPMWLLLVKVLAIFLGQAFPEELVFRGYVMTNLGGGWRAIVISSVLFGALHVFSNGGATTVPERLVYALMAMGFGLALAICRGGSLWLAIGFHLGFNVFHQLFVTPKASAPFELIVFAGLVIAAGTIHLARVWRKAKTVAAPRLS